MYGLIGKFKTHPGKGEELLALMLGEIPAMPGCLSYVVARDPKDPDGVWITEVWTDAASHKASLEIPEVRAVIQKAMPLIAGFDTHHETEPVGGVGLLNPGD
jgi:quinol monooxygenase YgiN